MFRKHHLQHPSQLCEMHIEHCSVLTATGFESTFAITAPLCLCLLFLFYLLALLLRLEMDFWATTMLPKSVDPPHHGILSCWEIWLPAENTGYYFKGAVVLCYPSIMSGLAAVFCVLTCIGNMSQIQQRSKDYSSVIG